MIKKPKPRLCLGTCHRQSLATAISPLASQEKPFVLSEQRHIVEPISTDKAQIRIIGIFGAGDVYHDIYDKDVYDIQQT